MSAEISHHLSSANFAAAAAAAAAGLHVSPAVAAAAMLGGASGSAHLGLHPWLQYQSYLAAETLHQAATAAAVSGAGERGHSGERGHPGDAGSGGYRHERSRFNPYPTLSPRHRSWTSTSKAAGTFGRLEAVSPTCSPRSVAHSPITEGSSSPQQSHPPVTMGVKIEPLPTSGRQGTPPATPVRRPVAFHGIRTMIENDELRNMELMLNGLQEKRQGALRKIHEEEHEQGRGLIQDGGLQPISDMTETVKKTIVDAGK